MPAHTVYMTYNASRIAATIAIALPTALFGMAGAIGLAYANPWAAPVTVEINVPGSPGFDAYAYEVGDDDADGSITAGESGWAADAWTVTVDGSEYPVCAFEDCSDQPAGIGVWFDPDTGAAWLSVGDHSLPIATGANAWDAGAYVGGWN